MNFEGKMKYLWIVLFYQTLQLASSIPSSLTKIKSNRLYKILLVGQETNITILVDACSKPYVTVSIDSGKESKWSWRNVYNMAGNNTAAKLVSSKNGTNVLLYLNVNLRESRAKKLYVPTVTLIVCHARNESCFAQYPLVQDERYNAKCGTVSSSWWHVSRQETKVIVCVSSGLVCLLVILFVLVCWCHNRKVRQVDEMRNNASFRDCEEAVKDICNDDSPFDLNESQ